MEQLTVPAAPSSTRAARQFVSAFCARTRLPQEICHDAALLVSELASNSVLHGRSEVRIRIAVLGPVLRVEVADDSPELPQLQDAAEDATGGRGIRIVDLLATRWGATRRTEPPPGKVVWFELATA